MLSPCAWDATSYSRGNSPEAVSANHWLLSSLVSQTIQCQSSLFALPNILPRIVTKWYYINIKLLYADSYAVMSIPAVLLMTGKSPACYALSV